MKSVFVKGWRPLVVLLLLFALWEFSVTITDTPKWLLPAPTQIFVEGFVGWNNFYPDVLSTIQIAVFGLVLGFLFGLIVALVLHLLPAVRQAFYPLLILSQNIPIIVLAPLLVIWFGFGVLPKLIVIVLVCFFPITVAMLDGFRQTSAELKHYLLMAGASKRQLFWKLELPSALPAMFSGLKIAATYSVMGAVISEWLGAQKGVGVYMTLASSAFRTDRVFVAIFTIMFLSLLLFFIIAFIEKKAVYWSGKNE